MTKYTRQTRPKGYSECRGRGCVSGSTREAMIIQLGAYLYATNYFFCAEENKIHEFTCQLVTSLQKK